MSKIAPVVKATVGQDVDAAIANLSSRVKALEGAAVSDEQKVVDWFKTNWPHVVTWASSAFVAFKVFTKL